MTPFPPQRIAKVIARSGLCSRRDAEKLIAAGEVCVDGERITTPALTVTPDQHITVKGKVLTAAQDTQLYKFYKPKAIMTTKHDPQGRATIYTILPSSLKHLLYVGRLDYHSEGLLLLTNDGSLSRTLELPSSKIKRSYRVRVHGVLDVKKLTFLSKGITLEGIHYAPFDWKIEHQGTSNHWLVLILTEGKNREIRKLLASIGLKVDRLIRTNYGPIQLGKLKPGEIEAVHNIEWLF
jgi:23S rRNA pseudouridine2605 synthase